MNSVCHRVMGRMLAQRMRKGSSTCGHHDDSELRIVRRFGICQQIKEAGGAKRDRRLWSNIPRRLVITRISPVSSHFAAFRLDAQPNQARAADIPHQIVDAFYQVRFGNRKPDAGQEAEIVANLQRLEDTIGR